MGKQKIVNMSSKIHGKFQFFDIIILIFCLVFFNSYFYLVTLKRRKKVDEIFSRLIYFCLVRAVERVAYEQLQTCYKSLIRLIRSSSVLISPLFAYQSWESSIGATSKGRKNDVNTILS